MKEKGSLRVSPSYKELSGLFLLGENYSNLERSCALKPLFLVLKLTFSHSFPSCLFFFFISIESKKKGKVKEISYMWI